ncbi:Non-catalytic module family DOC2, partial [Piromyces sp. E2]
TFELVGGSSNNNNNEKPADSSDNQPAPIACWSVGLGYNCCQSCIGVAYEDNDGKWGVEDGKWCGIPKDCGVSDASGCKGVQGYQCCKSACEVIATDDDGNWSVENNEWC